MVFAIHKETVEVEIVNDVMLLDAVVMMGINQEAILDWLMLTRHHAWMVVVIIGLEVVEGITDETEIRVVVVVEEEEEMTTGNLAVVAAAI